MKKLFVLAAVITTSLIATKSYSQVYVGARFGVRIPAPGVYDDGYYAPPATCEAEFPGYAYYDYPVWNGHYRDRYYFEHYRPFFEREHRAYFYHEGFNRYRFDHDRFDHERGGFDHDRFDHERGGFGHERFDHDRGGFDHERFDHDRGFHRGRG